MKKFVLGGALFVGGVCVGFEAYKRIMLSIVKDTDFVKKNILPKVMPNLEQGLVDLFGEDKMKAIMDIIES